MVILLTILIILTALALLYLLSIGGRWNHPKLRYFKQFHYAHRGLHDRLRGIPENSLTAFQEAAAHGFGAEIDVRMTQDGKLMVIHDNNIQRMTGADALVSELTGAELEQYTLLHTSEPIPYLEEVLPIFESAELPVIIELKVEKGNYKALANTVLDTLAGYPQLEYCVESFDPLALMVVRHRDKNIVRGQLSSNFTREPEHLHFPLTFVLKNLMLNFLSRPDFIAYKFKYRKCASVRLSKWLYDLQEFDWTIRTKPQANKALREGSAIIFEGFDPTGLPRK